ncbi:MAG: sulfurtransferase TusA family protein [Paracoccus sp. (in: a-proteobacteria)]|nr:sulfurtransferase TusA family protein [Paracoccus sp. (in: a-proteobacteria)]
MSRAAAPAPVTEIDARDLLCPLPVLRLRKALEAVAPGDRVTLIASDRMALIDVPHFCAGAGHRLISVSDDGDLVRFQVERAPSPAAGH